VRRAWLGLLAVCTVALALVLVRLGEPDWQPPFPRSDAPLRYVWDENLYAFTAHRSLQDDPDRWRRNLPIPYLAQRDPTDIAPHVGMAVFHPPLAVFLMTLSSRVLGWTPFTVRLPGALCGVLMIAGTWLLVRRARGDRAAAVAASLVMLDGVWFALSRVAIPHIYVAAATTLAGAATLAAWHDGARRARLTLVAGALCGVALAFKTSSLIWTAIFAAFLLQRAWTEKTARGRALAVWAAAFLVLPPLLYLASWTAFFVSWHKSWDDFLQMHALMRDHHAGQPPRMGPSTPWWTWPVLWKPVRIFHETDAQERLREIVAWGNPMLWWAALAAVPWAAVRWTRRRDPADALAVLGWLSAWVVFAFVPRFGFSYYMLPAAPFAALAVASALEDSASSPRARLLPWFWVTLAAGAFAAAYPMLAAVPRVR
jgi:4-amino-4-deoxy-L-arabinose transferase-like glycosyltransferase